MDCTLGFSKALLLTLVIILESMHDYSLEIGSEPPSLD